MNGLDIKSRRIEQGLSRKELANDLCVSSQSVTFWELGFRNMSPPVEKLFCVLYGYDLNSSSASPYDDDSQPYLFDDLDET